MIVKSDIELIENYLSDASNIKGNVEKVYIPENQDELIDLVIDLNKTNTPFTISAAGTGMSGGRVASEGCLISIEKLNKIIEINTDKNYAIVESGVVLKDLQDELEVTNSFYPVNPTENNSFIGGNIANNSSGSRSFKYGPTRNFVMELKVVLPNGELLNLERRKLFATNGILDIITDSGKLINLKFGDIYMPKAKNSTGYYLKKDVDAIDVFIGNEGTLGIILQAKLAILPNPEKLLGGIIFFENKQRCNDFVDFARESSYKSFQNKNEIDNKIAFRLIEYFDDKALALLKPEYNQIPQEAHIAIWFEQEYDEQDEEELLNFIYSIINKFTKLADSTWIAMNNNEHKDLYEFRHRLPLLVTDKISSNQFRKIGGDTSVPKDKFHEFYKSLYEIYENCGIDYVIFGHIGDCHLHADLFPQTQEQFEQGLKTYDKLINKTIELNGSISAEHGIGKVKKKYFAKMMGNANIEMMKLVKNTLDPFNLLGRGNLFD